jgi:hypothetical protein
MFEVLEIPAFPRRGKELHMHFVENANGDHRLADFTISNPCPGPHPTWNPQSMPVNFKDLSFEFSLQKFSADQSNSRTVCGFRVREGGRITLTWQPIGLEVSDATGNHWRPWLDSRLASVDGDVTTLGFFGALWPGEDAWKLRVEFKRLGEFPQEERLLLEDIPLPKPAQILQTHVVGELNGARVEVSKLLGQGADYEQVHRLNIERKEGWLTLVLNGRIRSLGRHLVLLEAKDEQGNTVESEGFAREFDSAGRSPDSWPYLLNVKPAAGARELNLLLAVTQSRFAEFIAKPTQTTSGSSL